jgi:tetratricopeptide (TPR) repeat protein
LAGRARIVVVAVFATTVLVAAVWLMARGGNSDDNRPDAGKPKIAASEIEPAASQPKAPGRSTIELPRIPFADVTDQWGVSYKPYGGAQGDKMLPESGGSGCALLDYDGDGDLDLLLLSGKAWPWDTAPADAPRSTIALYRNDGSAMVDVTTDAGLVADFYAQGAAVGDSDGDGDDDLFVTAVGNSRFYRNDGGRFVESATDVGLAGMPNDWTTSAGFFDYDRDGDLDLFVCNYVNWSRETDQGATIRVAGAGKSYAHPGNFEGTQNYLYRNDGGRFVDVSAAAGIHVTDVASGKPAGKSLAVTFVDFDRDGFIDVYVANDTVRHFLFRNLGDGRFEEIAEERGAALNAGGASTSGMSADAAWPFNDERLAIAVGNFSAEATEVFVSEPASNGSPVAFSDHAARLGLGEPTLDVLTFGLLFDDFDLDGRVDLVEANGHLEETIAQVSPLQYAQPAQLFWNAGAAAQPMFVELPADNVTDLAKPAVGRALAAGDLDGDGDVDLVLTQAGDRPRILRNDAPRVNHWLGVKLAGMPGNPHGVGAEVEIRAGGTTRRRTLMPVRSYLAASEPVVTFGLGASAQIDELTVLWPDGSRQSVPPPAVDQTVTVRQQAGSFAAVANRGKALLENSDFVAAATELKQALRLRPESLAVRRNLARAYLLSSQPELAIGELDELSRRESQPSAAASYLRGLAALRKSDNATAEECFAQAAELDASEGTFRYQWALALLGLNRAEDARAQLEKTIALDPLHGAAQYQLASLARKGGDKEAFTRYMRDYLRIRDLRGAVSATALETCRYTAAEPPETAAFTSERLPEVQFDAAELRVIGAEGFDVAGIAVVSMDDDGRYTLVLVATTGEILEATFSAEGALQPAARAHAKIGEVGANCVVRVANALVNAQGDSPSSSTGDAPEVAVVTPQRTWLLQRNGEGNFVDVTEAAGLAAAKGVAATWVDVEHDGDVDLGCIDGEGLQVWRNRGDGSFAEESGSLGLGEALGGTDLGAADLDGTNLGVDLVLVGGASSELYRNMLAGKFEVDGVASGAWPAAARVHVDGFGNNGLPDVAFVGDETLTVVATAPVERNQAMLNGEKLQASTTLDVDNDGWLDLAVVTESGAQLIRNADGKIAEKATTLPLATGGGRQLLDLDADGDGDTDLVAVGADGRLRLLRNQTQTGNRQIKLSVNSFVGHPSSIGVRIEARAEDLAVARWTNRELPIEIGVGTHREIDSIQTLWPNGIAKNEIAVRVASKPVRITIAEFIRTDSCPFLYAWVGGRWKYLNDVLSMSPLNVVVARGTLMPGSPREALVLGPAEQFADGPLAARLRVTSELREAVYVDQVRLLAVDHPVGTTLLSTDRIAPQGLSGPQFLLVDEQIAPTLALGSDDVDRTESLAAIDEVYAPPGRVLPPPVAGFTEPLSLELDFGGRLTEPNVALALTGWIRFGNSSSNIAASQRQKLDAIWPRLEALDADGTWQLVDDNVGLPAGSTKTIVCDLRGKLPSGATKLRLSTSYEVRWEAIALCRIAPDQTMRTTEIEPADADLAWHGFCELRPTSPDAPQVPNLDRVSNQAPWLLSLVGWCTRYGPVGPLAGAADRRSAILNSGDGLTLEFPGSGLPPIDRGSSRTLALATTGWIKAADPNSEPDIAIWPFPGGGDVWEGAEPENDWQLEYNTRWSSGSIEAPDAPMKPDNF